MLNSNKTMLELLIEEEEDDLLLKYIRNKRMKPISNAFLTAKGSKDFLKNESKDILLLMSDDIKFREFFRLNRQQFYLVLSLI